MITGSYTLLSSLKKYLITVIEYCVSFITMYNLSINFFLFVVDFVLEYN